MQMDDQINPLRVAMWCRSIFPGRTEFNLLSKHLELLTPDQKNALPSEHKAVTAYLSALTDLGYLKAAGGLTYYIQEGAPHWKRRVTR